ncbi:MAG: hypothetical protein V4622_14305 [Bacteroidota bacterium]
MKSNKLFLVATLFLAGFFIISSCRKKKDTIAKVYVMDASNDPVTSCTVVLYASPSENSTGKKVIAPDTSITNTAGEAIFNYNDLYQLGQAGVAVLNIKAYKDTLVGEGVIQIGEEVTSKSTVFLQ